MREIEAFRLAAQLKSTNIFHAGGLHELKSGFDGEYVQYSDKMWNSGPDGGRASVFVYPGDTYYLKPCFSSRRDVPFAVGPNQAPLLLLPPSAGGYYQDAIQATTKQYNTALFLQRELLAGLQPDLNLGVRWRDADAAGTILAKRHSPSTTILRRRVGVIFDPTKEGRSKIFAHYGPATTNPFQWP